MHKSVMSLFLALSLLHAWKGLPVTESLPIRLEMASAVGPADAQKISGCVLHEIMTNLLSNCMLPNLISTWNGPYEIQFLNATTSAMSCFMLKRSGSSMKQIGSLS